MEVGMWRQVWAAECERAGCFASAKSLGGSSRGETRGAAGSASDAGLRCCKAFDAINNIYLMRGCVGTLRCYEAFGAWLRRHTAML